MTRGLLALLTKQQEWIIQGDETVPDPLAGYVVSFLPFHKHSLGVPAHPFLWGLLYYYGSSIS